MSFPNNSAFAVNNGPTHKFQIDPNELYEYPGEDLITPLKTCPLVSEIKVVNAPLSGGDNYVFDTTLGQHQYLSNCVKLYFTIPLTVELLTADAADITELNFMKKLFENNSDICYSQYSILQAISNMQISFNDSAVATINNVAEAFNMIAPYYASTDVDEWFHASQPDRYQSFDQYTSETDKFCEYYDDMGVKTTTSLGFTNDSNIFGSTVQKGYSTRTPSWQWVAQGADKKKSARVNCTFFCYLPLSFGGVPSSTGTFSGLKRLTVSTHFKSSMTNYLFNTKYTGASVRYLNIGVDTAANTGSVAKMLLQIYTPPQYMRDSMINKATGLMKPYSVNYPRIMTSLLDSYKAVGPNAPTSFNRSDIQTNSVPSSIYIAVVKKKLGSFVKCTGTPINFGLIKNLTVKIDSAITSFNDIISLGLLSDSNGYDELDPIGRLIKGYPIKIDVSKDLSLPGDTVVGATGNFRIAVEGNFINQGDSVEEYQLVVVVVNNAALNFDGANFTHTSGAIIADSALRETNFLRNEYSKMARKVNVIGGAYGAGIFGSAGKWLKNNAANLARTAWNNRENIAGTIGDVMGLAKTLRGGADGGRLPASNVSGAGTQTLGAGKVRSSVFK